MLDPVTTRYAEALFNVARAQNALDAVQRDVERLQQGLARGEAVARLFDPRLPEPARRAEAEKLVGGAHALVKDFVALVFDKRREEVLRHLGEAFRRRLLLERNAAEGVAESARPLAESELAELARALGTRLSKTVTLTNRILPELLGGVRVTVDNRMIDASVRGRLEGLRKHLAEAPLPLEQAR